MRCPLLDTYNEGTMSRTKKVKGVTIATAAELLQVSVNTLRNWDSNGKLKAKRAKNGYRYYNISDLMRFAKKNNIKVADMKKLP